MYVYPSEQVIANQADEVYLRVGDKSKKLNFEQRLQLVYAKGVKRFEDQPVAGATMDDLDLESVGEYCRKIGFTRGDRVYRDMAEAGLPEPEYRQVEFMLSATLKNKNWGQASPASWVVNPHDTPHDTPHDQSGLIEFCATPRSRNEMMEFMGLIDRKHFTERYLKPLLASGKLEMTIPGRPQSKNQKYIAKK